MNHTAKTRRNFLRKTMSLAALGTMAGTGLLSAGCAQYIDSPQDVAPMIMQEAEWSLSNFRAIADLAKIDTLIPDASGILIFPRVVKGGFIAGVELGTGVLLSRTDTGWSYPAFYMLSAGSIGFQLGLQETAIIMIIRNQSALESIIEHQGKFGAEIGVMVGWSGIGYESATTSNLGVDIVAFTGPGFGVFGGVAMEGAAMVRRTDLNEYFYGSGATPRSIVLEGQFTNPAADALRAAIDPR